MDAPTTQWGVLHFTQSQCIMVESWTEPFAYNYICSCYYTVVLTWHDIGAHLLTGEVPTSSRVRCTVLISSPPVNPVTVCYSSHRMLIRSPAVNCVTDIGAHILTVEVHICVSMTRREPSNKVIKNL